MGWLIEAIANVCLELLGDLMAWTTNLITGLSLDIGMETTYVNGRYVPKVPDPGTLINPVGIKGYLLETIFPQAPSFTTLFMSLAMAIIAFMFLAKMSIIFFGPFVKTESGGTIMFRTGLAIFGTAYSYTIFVMFEALFNKIYEEFMSKYIAMTTGVSNYATSPDSSTSNATNHAPESFNRSYNITQGSGVKDAFNMFGKDLLQDYKWGQGLAVTVIAIALFAILLISFLKLVLEIYERYVIIGVLFYTAPLAFSTLVSKENNIFTNWVQMVISEFVVMCSNLFFTGVFIAAWHGKLTTSEPALFKDPQDFVSYMFIMIAWLIIGQQFDQHLKSLGLSTAQTGRSLGGAVVAGLGSAAMIASTAAGAISGGTRLAEKVATGKTAMQKAAGSQGGPAGDYFKARNNYAGLSKAEADKTLADIQSGKSHGFDMLNDSKKGEALTSLASSSMGAGFDRAISDQTGRSASSIDMSSVTFDSKGMLSGSTVQGESFKIQSPGGVSEGYSKAAGNGWSVPISETSAKHMAESAASSQPALKYGNEEYKWQINNRNYAEMIAVDRNGDVLETMHVPNLIAGAEIEKNSFDLDK